MTGLLLLALLAQNSEQRGFIEYQTLLYPQTAPNDSAQVIDQAAIRWEASYKLTPWLKLNGSLDALADTHQQVNRNASLNLDDRTIQRPALSLREFSAPFTRVESPPKSAARSSAGAKPTSSRPPIASPPKIT